ncbi:MAG: teichoic acid biosynthesis protein [Deltaproteobacteria bacterium]|nr:teichoic acid biosynthesis protein [Deltaproteobacteria bacterium]
MKILYGVVGEGMGHATRSRVVLDWLTRKHEVHVVVSGRAYDFLSARFPNVHKIWGATIAYEDNAVSKLKTAIQNAKAAVAGVPENVKQYFEISERFRPDVVVSDFDTFAYLYGLNWMLPVISIDNMQIINRCRHDASITAGHESDFQLTRNIVKGKLPGCHHYLVTTFFHPPVRKPRTSLLPPILRPEILEAQAERADHLLVYQTSTSNSELPKILQGSGLRARVYGLRRDLKEDMVDGNLTYRPFSEKGFIDDLRSSRAVIANGGFTLMSECVYLHKPMLSLPVAGQFEQVLNARYLEQLGFGLYAPELTGDLLERFLLQLPFFEKKLAGYRQDGNSLLLAKLDELLVQVGQGSALAPGAVDAEPPSLEAPAFKER